MRASCCANRDVLKVLNVHTKSCSTWRGPRKKAGCILKTHSVWFEKAGPDCCGGPDAKNSPDNQLVGQS